MTLMTWDPNLSVGDETIDAQHEKLINLINEAYESVQKHDEKQIGKLIDKMRQYADVHFSAEEALMKRDGFPGLEEHKFHHEKFRIETQRFHKERFSRTNLSQIFVFLSRWLINHIMEDDMRYARYIRGE